MKTIGLVRNHHLKCSTLSRFRDFYKLFIWQRFFRFFYRMDVLRPLLHSALFRLQQIFWTSITIIGLLKDFLIHGKECFTIKTHTKPKCLEGWDERYIQLKVCDHSFTNNYMYLSVFSADSSPALRANRRR